MDAKKIEEGFQEDKIINETYVIAEELGSGGMGLVYLAHDLNNMRRRVVVKTLKKEALGNEYVLKHFHQEAEALGRINHDGVVKMIDKGRDAETGLSFIVMEFADGPTMTKVINRELMNAKKCADLIQQIAFALTAAHNEGVLHRDLKPDNIIVIERPHEPDKIKLIDFGIAKVKESSVGQSTVMEVLVGTLEYLSPEQLNYTDQTIQGEVFSLAAVAYQMLTQRFAFPLIGCRDRNEKVNKLRELHKKGPKSPKLLRPDLSNAAEKVLLKALSLSPEKRYEFPIDFAKALAAALENKAPVAPAVKYKTRSRWKLIRRNLLPLAGLLCLLAGVSYYYFFYRQRSAHDVQVSVPKTIFQNSREGLSPALKSHFINFSFERPVDWTVRRAGKDDFADVGKFTADGTPVEQIRVGWYPSKDAFGDQQKLEELAKTELSKTIPGYARNHINSDNFYDGRSDAVRFRETGKSGNVTIWGLTLFYKNGLRLTMIASSLSPDVKDEEDVAMKGGLSTVFRSFKLLSDKR